jgi:hypothetical protein
MWIGLFLVLAGILVLLNNMDILRGDIWGYVWPLFFIMLGSSMVLKRLREPNKGGNLRADPESKGSMRDPVQ